MDQSLKIQCLGAAGTVTGSKFLLQTPEKNIMIDCGMFQGLKNLRILNWADLPIDPQKVDLILITHGHLDHVGYLPRFVSQGFKGKIWATEPTIEIAKIILQDSARIQEEDAERANRKGFSRHKPAKPLYTMKDVEKVYPLFTKQETDKWIRVSKNIECRYSYNSHILGATFIELKLFGKTFVFSGDIGREDDLLMHAPTKPEKADILFIESTYGNRLHPKNSMEGLENAINDAAINKGPIIIPGFAVERIQMLMYMIWKLMKSGRVPQIPIYMDSPMGTNVLKVFDHYPEWHKLSSQEIHEMSNAIRLVQSVEETEKLATDKSLKIIIAGAGMASGGRVLTYFQHQLGNPSATILLAGYQAEGTRGRQLLEGAVEIKLLGNYYPVNANIKNIEGLSAHADQKGLLDWMSKIKSKPGKIVIVHGEPKASETLKEKIKEMYGWDSEIPKLGDVIEC